MRIYFSGIGGVGIGPLAEIAHDAGYQVMGSDQSESLMTKQLESLGIAVSFDQSGANLQTEHYNSPIDWFIYTSSLPNDHSELTLAKTLGIKTAKRDELLAYIINEKNLKLIAVAGTHGKTTTTGMLVWAMKKLGVPVSYSIGTTLNWGPSGHFDPTSQYFVYECDEFDRNFLHFSPFLSLITSIEYDHPDTYPSEKDYFAAFSQFATQSEQMIMWSSDATFIDVPDTAWLLADNEVNLFRIVGEHNRRNATLVAKALEYLHLEQNDNLSNFPGTNRRFEKLADNLYSDYGHTPTEIKATLQLARELSPHVVLVYQPHQNIRQHEIASQYTDDIFANAEEIYWLPTYLSREDETLEILTPAQLAKNLNASKVHLAELDDTLWQEISRHRATGDLVLMMGAGSIDGWVRSKL